MTTLFDFEPGHRVLVVGGAGDIGSAIARAFADAGCEVIATGVDEAAVKASALNGTERVTLAALDVTDDASVAAFCGQLGRLDTLVNCAGILSRGKEYEIEVFQKVIDVNLTGTFRLCNACLPLLENSKQASIVNIASMNAYAALPLIPAYCASKGGVVMLTKALAMAWASKGVRVNAVAPGYVETAINAEGRKDREHHARIASRIPLGRWAQPDDISPAVVFMASPGAHYMTGTVLAADGGFLAG